MDPLRRTPLLRVRACSLCRAARTCSPTCTHTLLLNHHPSPGLWQVPDLLLLAHRMGTEWLLHALNPHRPEPGGRGGGRAVLLGLQEGFSPPGQGAKPAAPMLTLTWCPAEPVDSGSLTRAVSSPPCSERLPPPRPRVRAPAPLPAPPRVRACPPGGSGGCSVLGSSLEQRSGDSPSLCPWSPWEWEVVFAGAGRGSEHLAHRPQAWRGQ